MSISIWDNLPREIWEKILDSLDTHGLQQAQNTCASWREIVLAYIMNGRLGNRALLLERLQFVDNGLFHKRNICNTLSLRVTPKSVILIGVGVYGGTDEELLDESLNITFDRTTTTVNVFEKATGNLVANQKSIWSTKNARRYARSQKPMPNTYPVFFGTPCLLTKGQAYLVEQSIQPTDVQNHFSGWPVTILGAEIWTCHGDQGSQLIETVHQVQFEFMESERGRSCHSEGQMPYLLWWIL
ncbi:uncharacterized protein LOC131887181 isoform X1 [Tigriopus californicus]|uniref:uncharacterized protein LOC131887181 isoform X1 n=1 Tax=Tigriopus californicus TaxID=6832 RepID=UPI0027DA9866|nr:uncharacterized protein LOC131887181 isoform X1 [Tigriopus californicus]